MVTTGGTSIRINKEAEIDTMSQEVNARCVEVVAQITEVETSRERMGEALTRGESPPGTEGVHIRGARKKKSPDR